MKNKLKKYCAFSAKDTLITILILLISYAVCMGLNVFIKDGCFSSMLFIMAVFLISRFTNGYFYGIVSSLISVLAVNFFFTYPFFNFNFTLEGYPLTVTCMLAVSVVTSTMTTRIKEQERIKFEAETEKTRSNLLRAISHDLRTPLTSIIGSSSVILENYDSIPKEEQLKLISGINEDSQWLIRMVENLLSVTRINADGDVKITKVPEIVEELVAESVNNFKKRFNDIPVNVKVPAEMLIVPMDAMLVNQVITNLLINAATHSKVKTEINLSVGLEQNFAVFEVSDNGVGISRDIIADVFNGTLGTKSGALPDSRRSMGIGLSVCNTIVKAHGGMMYAYNKDSGGAVFRFTIPLEDKTI